MEKENQIIYDDDDILSPIDAAKIVGVSRTTVNYWVRHYGLKADVTPGKRYRIKYGDLKVFLSFNKKDKRIKLRRRKSKYKIAFLEPSNITRENYVNWLKDDYDIYSVSNFANPLKELRRFSPDIIIMEVTLENPMDGFSVLDDIRKEIFLKTTLIIFITKMYDEDYVVRGLENGACDYVKKPVGQNELRARIKNAMRYFVDI